MKKIIVLWMSLMLVLSLSLSSVFALDTASIKSAYTKIAGYYKNKDNLESLDEIFAYEALDMEAEKKSGIVPIKASDVYSGGSAAKYVLALSLMKEKPESYQGDDFVKILESYIQDDGSIQGSYGASDDIWVIMALYAIQSDKLDTCLKHFTRSYQADDAFMYSYEWDGTTYSGHDFDTAGLTIAVLATINRSTYGTYIKNLIKALKDIAKDNQDGSWADPYSGNPDSQARILLGLETYDKDGLLNDTYSLNDQDPYSYLLNYQLSSGGFYYGTEKKVNAIASNDAAYALGGYTNGFFLKKAKTSYEAAQDQPDTPEDTAKPVAKLTKKNYTYTGKTIKAKVKVTVNGKTLASSNYKLSYNKTPKKVGSYKVTVTYKGSYKNNPKKSLTFAIIPKKVTPALKGSKGKIAVSYQKAGLDNVLYKIAYKKKGAKKYTTKKTKYTKTTLKNLKKGTYSVKVLAYKGSLNSGYSAVKKVKVA